MSVLWAGVKIKSIYGPAPIEICYTVAEEGKAYAVKSIVVTMEIGQMAAVPWGKVTKHDGTTVMVNLALMEEVILDD